MSHIAFLRWLALAVVSEVRRAQVPFLAAAVAFYGFVSIIPIALLGLAAGHYLDGNIVGPLLEQGGQFLTPSALALVEESVADGAGSGGATVVGLLFLAWSATKIFRGLDVAFSQVYGAARPEPLADLLLDAVIVLVAIPLAFGSAAVLGVILPNLGGIPFIGFASGFGLIVVLGAVFFPIYYRFPDVPMTARGALPGTVFAAVGWAALAGGFTIYVDLVGNFQLYGVLGAGLLVVTWLYLGGIIIMVGAVLNAVLAGGPEDEAASTERSDSDRTEPAPDLGELHREVRSLRTELDEKTVSRSDLEGELKGYVRRRIRRGKARGWGPYLVLLYGTAMTLGAFYWLSGGWAILAMIVVWLSTLGLYVMFVLFGAGLQAAGVPGRALDVLRDLRS